MIINMLIQKSEISVTMYCCMYADCGSEYATKFNLKRHVESVHMMIKKFKCQTCGNLFISKQSLKEHHHIHLNSMPFKCVTCNKAFRQASQLSLHKRIHTLKGIPAVYEKNTPQQDGEEFLPMKVEYTPKTERIVLPLISNERKQKGLLPFPRMF